MSKHAKKWVSLVILVAMAALALAGCMPGNGTEPSDEPSATQGSDAVSGATPSVPAKLALVDGVPQLTVYDIASKSNKKVDIESYVEGVLAGEMRNDWPMEALKAQAILARTFVLKFVSEKNSKYNGADISTDITEAQAYDEQAINDRIKRAVNETRGLVLVSGGDFPYAWFHAHAGGQTELAKAALDYKPAEPEYTKTTDSPDSDKAPDAVKNWTATFTADEVEKAAADAGVKTGTLTSISIGDKGESGRAINFVINGKKVSGPALRLAIDAKKLKSTLVSSVKLENGRVTFSGKGFGHGVGMSQWGAYGMAEQGKNAEEIATYYFDDVRVVHMWD